MTKRMLIDATHAEETRVVVLDGSRLEDFDVETSTKRQLKGNIYLAKVVRVEPSLQAAFVEYGGNRHGFLAFGEIHPDYYQIPVADRQRLIEMQAEDARLEEEEEDRAAEAANAGDSNGESQEPMAEGPVDEVSDTAEPAATIEAAGTAEPADDEQPYGRHADDQPRAQPMEIASETVVGPTAVEVAEVYEPATEQAEPVAFHTAPEPAAVEVSASAVEVEPFDHDAGAGHDDAGDAHPSEAHDHPSEAGAEPVEAAEDTNPEAGGYTGSAEPIAEQPPPETVGGDGDNGEDAQERRIPPRFLRNYKIQEVIKRRQILLVQVVKEERGTKGAALTTYLSLAGRFGVLMPNSPRGGGISRKITSPADRRRLKEVMAELEIPQGMGIIVRTAGANRPKPEIKRDCEYLLRLWDEIREHTLKSVAPALIYEEASLIKRAIRDVYSRDIDEIQVDGEQGWRAAHEFMRMLMPSHAKKVQLWRNGGQPLFSKYQVEAQLDSMLMPTAQLRSGGYLVINQAEALVAIDVNSGRSTRERGIEETALRTNMEAADEVARQLRLRDLAGLIVIDFIDMESKKHNGMVERRLTEALKNDRARIQVGHISHFGLMEMSRQRLRPSLAETSFIPCPHCGGIGHVRSTESAAIHVLRGVEDEGAKRRAAEIVVHAAPAVALYLLNHKRDRLNEIELRYGMRVLCFGDETQMTSQFRIDRVRAQVPGEAPAAITQEGSMHPVAEAEPEVEAEEDVVVVEDEDEEETAAEAAEAVPGETAEEAEHRRRRRRRRRRGGRRDESAAHTTEGAAPVEAVAAAAVEAPEAAVEEHIEGVPEHAETAADDQRNRRRGRRGGRRRRPEDGVIPPHAAPGADQPELPPVYSGPTPANPFGGHAFDIFDVLEQAEERPQVEAVAPAEHLPSEPQAAAMPPVIAAAPAPVQVEADGAEAAPEPVTPERVTVEPEPAHAEQHSPGAPDPHAEAHGAEAASGAATVEPAHAQAEERSAEAPPEPQAEPVSETEPESLVAANDAAAEPAIKPIIVGGGEDVVVEKKRGWWRR
jgi:ribonuclease E